MLSNEYLYSAGRRKNVVGGVTFIAIARSTVKMWAIVVFGSCLYGCQFSFGARGNTCGLF